MKKIIITCSAFLILLVMQSLIMKKDGAAPGYTGSPGDSMKNCTACHGGTALIMDSWVTSDIPASGYVPGQTYTVTATNKEFGATRFGFEVSPQDINGNLLGTMVVTDAVRTKLVGGTKYITYTENGVEGIDTLAWSFKWIAPEKPVDEVVFYGAFNSNFEGHKDGDKTYLSTLTVKRDPATSIGEVPGKKVVRIYPNPTCDYVQVDLDVKLAGHMTAEIIDMNGRQVALFIDGAVNSGAFSKRFDITSLAYGQYLVRVNINGTSAAEWIRIVR